MNSQKRYKMGAGGRNSLTSSRSEFLAAEAIDSQVIYKPGCFVSLKKGILLSFFLAIVVTSLSVISYYYGIQNTAKTNEGHPNEIEILLNDTSKVKTKLDTRLPKNIIPIHYRLKLKPNLDARNSTFTFNGHVTITIQATEETKFIVLNAENLQILENQVTVSTSASHDHSKHRRKRQLAANGTAANAETNLTAAKPPQTQQQQRPQQEKPTQLNTTKLEKVNVNASKNANTDAKANADANKNAKANVAANVSASPNVDANANVDANVSASPNGDVDASVNANVDANVGANVDANVNANVDTHANGNINGTNRKQTPPNQNMGNPTRAPAGATNTSSNIVDDGINVRSADNVTPSNNATNPNGNEIGKAPQVAPSAAQPNSNTSSVQNAVNNLAQKLPLTLSSNATNQNQNPPPPTNTITNNNKVLVNNQNPNPASNTSSSNGTHSISSNATTYRSDAVLEAPNVTAQMVTATAAMTEPTVVSGDTASAAPNVPQQTTATVFQEQIVAQHFEPSTARYTVNLLYSLEPGINYTVDISFSGAISEDFLGLYRTYYRKASDEQSWMVSTNFPTKYARRAFPCFDEPAFKTPFDIIVGRRTNYTALSNMPLIRTETISNQPEWVWDFFQTTPPMSTFAVAVTVMDFESIAVTNASVGTVLKIWAPHEELPNAKYALDVGYKVFKYYEEYFGVKYPLPKLDFVVTPRIIETASENWGLISFNYLDILVNQTEMQRRNIEKALSLVCEALPHQWIGDLVTMPWWSDAWLKESFAQIMTRIGVNVIEPDWEVLERYPSKNIRNVLWGDSLKTTRNVYTDIDDPTEFEDVMDSLVGKKGGALLRMLQYTLSEPVFKKGIQEYIENGKFKNVAASKLWDYFDKNAKELNSTLPYGITVKDMMESWTLQPGYPVIHVTRNYTNGSVIIEQEKFAEKNDTKKSLWCIPLNYMSSDSATRLNDSIEVRAWLNKQKRIVLNNVTSPGNGSWLLFNVFQIGIYRVNYDVTNWRLLQRLIEENPTEIYAINRAQIIDDAFEMAKLGYLDYNVPLELTQLLHQKERSPLTWSAVFRTFIDLRDMLGGTPYNGLLQKYYLSVIQPLYTELGTTDRVNESEDMKTLRNIVINHACLFRYQPCLDWAELQFKHWSNNTIKETNDVLHKYEVQCMAIQIGGEKEWDIVWTKAKNSSRSDLDINYMSLGCARDAWLITRYLERALDGSVPIHYVPTVWKSMTFESRDHGFKFLRGNWARIYQTFKNNPLVLKAIIEFLTQLSTETDLSDLTTFYKSNNDGLNNFSALMLNAVDQIKLKIQWTNTRMESVISWLKENYGIQ